MTEELEENVLKTLHLMFMNLTKRHINYTLRMMPECFWLLVFDSLLHHHFCPIFVIQPVSLSWTKEMHCLMMEMPCVCIVQCSLQQPHVASESLKSELKRTARCGHLEVILNTDSILLSCYNLGQVP